MVTQLILRVLVLRATTRLGFFWVDEPLEHLDPDARRALAVLLAQAPEEPSFRQVLVTTYEEPLIRRLRASIPDTHLVYVRPSTPAALLDRHLTGRHRTPPARFGVCPGHVASTS